MSLGTMRSGQRVLSPQGTHRPLRRHPLEVRNG
jgi:hypothetical protein